MMSQVQVLNKILETKDFSIVTLNNLDEKYFFNYKAEFNYIKNHYEQYHTVPDKMTFFNVFPEFEYFVVNEPDTFLLTQLFEDYNTSYMAGTFNNVKQLIESGQTAKAMELYKKSWEGLQSGGALTCTDLMSDTSRYDRYLEKTVDQSKYYIKTGFKELDAYIGGIDLRNEDMVIAARTGVGKSWLLIKLAVEAAIQGKTVGIYSGEMSVDKVGYRVDTLIGHINNKDINRGNIYSQAAYKNYFKSLPDRKIAPIKVITPNDIAGPATVAAMQAFIEKEHLDILFIDQYSLLDDTSHAKQMFEKVGNISTAIKKLQVRKQIPIISVTQMNRTKNEDGSQDTTQISLSDKIGQDATIVLMLDKKVDEDQSDENKTVHIFTINVVKARDGGEGKKLSYNIDFNTGVWTYIPEEMDNTTAQSMRDSYESDLSDIGVQDTPYTPDSLPF